MGELRTTSGAPSTVQPSLHQNDGGLLIWETISGFILQNCVLWKDLRIGGWPAVHLQGAKRDVTRCRFREAQSAVCGQTRSRTLQIAPRLTSDSQGLGS